MDWVAERPTHRTTSRRRVLKTLAASGAIGTGGLAGCVTDGGSSTPTPEEPPTFVLSTVQSGPYGHVGTNERHGFELAVEHLNEGGGLVDAGAFDDLSGDGVLGHEVETATYDSEGSGETARSNLLPHMSDGSTAMICGGVTGTVARAHREIAAEHDVPFMAGTTLLDEFAGEQCASTMYRELYSSSALMEALGPTLVDEVGESVKYFQLYTDTPEGEDLKRAVSGYFNGSESANWTPHGNRATQPGSTNFEDALEQAANSRPGAVFLNMSGLDAINALSAAIDVLSEDTRIVVPLIDDSLGHVLGSDVAGVLGTKPWDGGVDSEYIDPYNAAYMGKHGPAVGGEARSGSGTAHVTYVQTLQFAAAAERAGSYDSVAIQAELRGNQYDVGLGSQELQSCNHQATRAVPVVRGRSSRTSSGDYFELLTLEDDVVSGCQESPASACSM